MPQNKPKMTFVGPPMKKRRSFKFLEKLTFSQMFFNKIKKFKTLNLAYVRNNGIGFTTVKL